jgi:hypothetical protein
VIGVEFVSSVRVYQNNKRFTMVVKRKRLPRKIHRSNSHIVSSVDNIMYLMREIITIFLANLEETISIVVATGIDRNFELEWGTRQLAEMLRTRQRELDDGFVIDSQHMIAGDEDDMLDEEDVHPNVFQEEIEDAEFVNLRTSAVREERIAKAMLVQQCEKICANKKKFKKKTGSVREMIRKIGKRQPRLKTTMLAQPQSLIPSKKKDPPMRKKKPPMRKKKHPLGKSEMQTQHTNQSTLPTVFPPLPQSPPPILTSAATSPLSKSSASRVMLPSSSQLPPDTADMPDLFGDF